MDVEILSISESTPEVRHFNGSPNFTLFLIVGCDGPRLPKNEDEVGLLYVAVCLSCSQLPMVEHQVDLLRLDLLHATNRYQRLPERGKPIEICTLPKRKPK